MKYLYKKVKNKIINLFTKKEINRYNLRNEKDAVNFLVNSAVKYTKSRDIKKILIIGDNKISKNFYKKIKGKDIKLSFSSVSNISNIEDSFGCIVSTFFDSNNNHKIANLLLKNNALDNTPFEYIIFSKMENSSLIKHNKRNSAYFISPLSISEIDFFKIYEESLRKFNKKCQIKAYMDIVQILERITHENIPGDVAEFGSFQGHSGFLIASVLKAMKSDKKVYLFDTFSEFPNEKMGIDALWNKSHLVNFNEIKEKFKDLDNVEFVKGDFTETLFKSGISNLSFAYIDCDSFRGTEFLLKNVYNSFLNTGGGMILEDYGHPPLLGARVATHNFFGREKNIFRFFSQFSGMFIILKE